MKSKKIIAIIVMAVTVCVPLFGSNNLKKDKVKADSNLKTYVTSRFSGLNRFDTSKAIASEYAKSSNEGVILALGSNFPDALSGSVLSQKLKAPILLSGSTVDTSQVALSYIQNNLSKDKKIYILGGTGGIKQEVQDKLTSLGYSNVKRIGGTDRFQTNEKIVDELSVSNGTPVVIANGMNFPDALSISAIAAAKGYPILLTTSDIISDDVKEKLQSIKPSQVYVIGGTGSVSDSSVSSIKSITGLDNSKAIRIGGADRYETSLNIAKFFNTDSDTATFASGQGFADALAGSALSAQKSAPLILVNNSDVSKQKDYIDSSKYVKEVFYGGNGSITDDIISILSKDYDKFKNVFNGDKDSSKTDVDPNQTLTVSFSKTIDSSSLSNISVTDDSGNKAKVTLKVGDDGKSIVITPANSFTDPTGTVSVPANTYKCNTKYTINLSNLSSAKLQFKTRDYKLNPSVQGIVSEDYLAAGDKYESEMWNIKNASTGQLAGSLWKAHESNGSLVYDTDYNIVPSQITTDGNKYANLQNKNIYNLQVELRKQYNKILAAHSDYAGYSLGFSEGTPMQKYSGDVYSQFSTNIFNQLDSTFSFDLIYKKDYGKDIAQTASNGNDNVINTIIEQQPQVVFSVGSLENNPRGNLSKLALYETLSAMFGADYAGDIYHIITSNESPQSSTQIGNIKITSNDTTYIFKY